MPRIAVGVTDPEPEDKACTSLVNLRLQHQNCQAGAGGSLTSCILSALGGTLAQVYE